MSYLTMRLLALQLFTNSTDTQWKLRLNLHSLSVSVSELLEYRRKSSLESTNSLSSLVFFSFSTFFWRQSFKAVYRSNLNNS